MTNTPGFPDTDNIPPSSGPEPVCIVALVGSVRHGRVGSAVADWLVRVCAHRTDCRITVIDVADVDLPLAGTRPGGNPASPIAGQLADADGFVIVTPEYNHSYPAALKNAIDWHFREWHRKPVAFVSYGAESGGIRAVEHLRGVFAELRAATIRPAVALSAPWATLDEAGRFPGDNASLTAAGAMLDDLVWWARALRTARKVAVPDAAPAPAAAAAGPGGRPRAAQRSELQAVAIAEDVVRRLQQGLDQGDADLYNSRFAADVLWGSPFGATVSGFDTLHDIHGRMLSKPRPGSRYELVAAAAIADDVVCAQVRRTAPNTAAGASAQSPVDRFSEMAMYVLVRRRGEWWLAAGQNTPIRSDMRH